LVGGATTYHKSMRIGLLISVGALVRGFYAITRFAKRTECSRKGSPNDRRRTGMTDHVSRAWEER
jgi:hypothetical protein